MKLLLTNKDLRYSFICYLQEYNKLNGKPEQNASGFFVPKTMKKLKVFMKVEAGNIKCICLQKNKMCKRWCLKDEVSYDQYKDLLECFSNRNGEVKL